MSTQPQQGGLLGSFGQFPGRMKELATNPQATQGLLANPMFQMGMGLLNANQNPDMNAAQGLLHGLQQSRTTKQEDDDRKRIERLRAELAALLAQRQGGPQMSPAMQQPDTSGFTAFNSMVR